MPPWLQLIHDSFWRLFIAGLYFTLPLALLSFFIGLILGLLVTLIRLYSSRYLQLIANFYVWVIRGTPLLVQLFLIFYGLPSAGITLDAFPAALIGFTLNIGAYSSEIIRGAILSVPLTQWEAAWAIGMNSTQAMIRVILPQAIFVALPPLANSFISLIKDTSLAAVITVPEIFLAAQRIVSVTYEPLILYIEAAAIYLLYSTVLGKWQTKLESYFLRY
ncbi:amino acid ABC transporter permease [Candidatus Palibaumannia cicadellinicola]|uniref:Amino acid ABC transporter, permease protein n=1 Tax=Baumannia cicadellinicola subsp. Homalodisca coagulata TaxID=374463 RepID=Q1LTQ1_BAUCH|nr:amino acid ABC transporter permease [Candidatus Baumannia cicadellinicola]ABF14050.1 amino acid ABC transporter, permease protein [Baumannia cicadellinicola str. Hc (Homalodisca coagulata)]MBS0032920.1 amino acid ABC transporter permease [Candidatus Baumannia cicadellinicola]MCJ7462354.1 amino acid ABC transporter permease [Candidatus Baumannia cicadellinicola]MCJ7462671.1 amino acid ABC transporter permease [Candidatus Baumannia cicadellinicola]